MPHDAYKALYIHIPFCVKRCLYCDFTTRAVPREAQKITAYIEDICMQIRRLAKAGELAEIETIYIGGGTPTHVGTKGLSLLLYTLSTSIDLSKVREFTVEANSESIDEHLINDIWALGANRLSIGVQSFNDDVLRTLGRAHTAEQAIDAVLCAKNRFDNISIDLMCGISGQTEDDVRASIEQALALDIPHISVYPLTVEPHTPLYNMVLAGEFPEPDEDVQAQHMQLAGEMLQASGRRRYEVASYALPGYESRHNKAYWSGVPYKGVGLSAATMTQNASRRMREQDGYITDDLNAAEMAAEDLMLGMRMAEGVSHEKVRAASELIPAIDGVFADLIEKGLVESDGARYKPTELGWLCGNELYGALLDSTR